MLRYRLEIDGTHQILVLDKRCRGNIKWYIMDTSGDGIGITRNMPDGSILVSTWWFRNPEKFPDLANYSGLAEMPASALGNMAHKMSSAMGFGDSKISEILEELGTLKRIIKSLKISSPCINHQ